MLNTDTQSSLDLNPVTPNTALEALEALEVRDARVKLASMIKIKHILSDGVYIKTHIVPKGLQFYTKQFSDEHVSIWGMGSAIVDNGHEKIKLIAPMNIKIKAMTRYKVLVLEDSVFYCIHATNETDLQVLDKTY